jgi:hypothetical protein
MSERTGPPGVLVTGGATGIGRAGAEAFWQRRSDCRNPLAPRPGAVRSGRRAARRGDCGSSGGGGCPPLQLRPGRRRAAIAPQPPASDHSWVIDGEPVYHMTWDKKTCESVVTFGIRSRLRPPSGVDLRSDELFTAWVRPGRPDGATAQAEVGISLCLPAGERIQVAVRSTSHRRLSAIEASVVQDGATPLHRRWAGGDPDAFARIPDPRRDETDN